nr:MAG TPA: hypothetical protein [Caudoviricetes sp.]
MATLDEVILQASNQEYLHDDIQFIIDNDLRIVSIPDRGIVAGVTGDKNVNRINFQMPRYYNGFDMSEFTTKVNYVNANGNMNYYAVTDLTVENDTILFTWLIDSDAVAYSGVVVFAVNMIKMTGSKISQSFNTSNKGRMTVLDGIQVDEYVTPEAQEDILTRIEADAKKEINLYTALKKQELGDVTNSSKQAIADKETASKNAIKSYTDSQVSSAKTSIDGAATAGVTKVNSAADSASNAAKKSITDKGNEVIAEIAADKTKIFISSDTGKNYWGKIKIAKGKPTLEYDEIK